MYALVSVGPKDGFELWLCNTEFDMLLLSTTPVIIRWYKWHKQKAYSHQTSHYSRVQAESNTAAAAAAAGAEAPAAVTSAKRLNYIHFFQ